MLIHISRYQYDAHIAAYLWQQTRKEWARNDAMAALAKCSQWA